MPPKRHELLKLPSLIAQDFEVHVLSTFVSQLTMKMDLTKYYNTCELTAFLYSCLINSSLKLTSENEHALLVQLHNKVYPEMPLNDSQTQKIVRDLEYIKRNKLYIKISKPYYYWCQFYSFFFVPNIYVVERT